MVFPLSQVVLQKPQTAVVHGKMCVNNTTAHTMQDQTKATSFKFLILSFFFPQSQITIFLSVTHFYLHKHRIVSKRLSTSTHSFLSPVVIYRSSSRVCVFFCSQKNKLDNSLVFKGLQKFSSSLLAILSSVSIPCWPGVKCPFEILCCSSLSSRCSWLAPSLLRSPPH